MKILPLPVLLLSFLLPRAVDSSFEEALQEPAQEEEVGPLEERMLVLKRGMRALRRGLKDPEKVAASLEIVTEMAAAVGQGKILPLL